MMAVFSYPELFFLLGLCLFFVILSGLFSGSETGLYCINQTRLKLTAHKQEPGALRLQQLLTDRNGLLFTTLFGTNLANYLAPLCLTVVFLHAIVASSQDELERRAELFTTLILTPIVFIFGEIVPKNLFQRNADRLMRRVSHLLRLSHLALQMSGIIWLQRKIYEFSFRRLHGSPPHGTVLNSRGDVYHMLREGAAEGALTRTQISILERIHLLKGISVGDVMVPHSRAVLLPADADRAQVERTLRNSRFSRMPVYRRNRRRIVGVVHLLDILTAPSDRPIREMAFSPVEISADTPVVEALTTLQRLCRRMAIVVAPNGRCVGIVTVKDLVEEIVGELAVW